MSPQISYADPCLIDGEPAEVAAEAKRQLQRVTRDVEALVQRSIWQIRSAYLSAQLAEDDMLTADELAALWNESGAYAQACRLEGAAGSIARMAEGL